MPFDAFTISAIRQELESTILGGRVQNIIAPGPLALSLEIYRGGIGRKRLLLSAHPQHARVHLSTSSPSRDPEQHPPLLLLLRKYVRGGTITRIAQPPYERVLALSIAKRFWPDKHQEYHLEEDFRHSGEDEKEEPDAPITTVELYIEVMGRLSNIVLVDEDGAVLDSIKRVPPSINRYRTTLPHHHYVLPPPQEKRDPARATINTLALELIKADEADPGAPVWKGLVSGFSGISPVLAREITFRSLGDLKRPAGEVSREPTLLTSLIEAMSVLLEQDRSGEWQPTVAFSGTSDSRKPVEFAPYQITHLNAGGAELVSYGSISEAASAYFESLQAMQGHSALKTQVRAEIQDMLERDERRLRALREELKHAEALEELRRNGEYLLAYAHAVEPGQTSFPVPGEGFSIELDPALSPTENAQAIFKEYRKAKSAQAGLPEKVGEAEMQVRYAEEMLTSLDIASSYDEIKAVQAELRMGRANAAEAASVASGKPADPKPRAGKAKAGKSKLPQPLHLRTRTGAHMLVGRTASQNDIATFRMAAPDDLWLHARGVPGSHVILRTEGGITNADIEEAASVAAALSKARNEGMVDVLCTERRHVRRVPNAPPGLVTFKNERVIRVAPRPPDTHHR
ncbi:MAG TPA: NFACT RNA binding domain-containing protein [Chloroflexia bacterium]|nr:NFACT RNA binding domain-containing protein [Chloroflexia bacterium]